MDTKYFIKIAALLGSAALSAPSYSAIIGGYNISTDTVANELISASGSLTNNNLDWHYSGTDIAGQWESSYSGGNWEASSAPGEATDLSVSSYLANTTTINPTSLELGFSNSTINNGAGSDIVFYFLWDQTGNAANISINGFNDVALDIQDTGSVANGVSFYDTQTGTMTNNNNVELWAAAINLSEFGYSLGDTLDSSILINLDSESSTVMALSMVAGIEHVQAVPIPAAIWLFITGLLSLGFVSRRKG